MCFCSRSFIICILILEIDYHKIVSGFSIQTSTSTSNERTNGKRLAVTMFNGKCFPAKMKKETR